MIIMSLVTISVTEVILLAAEQGSIEGQTLKPLSWLYVMMNLDFMKHVRLV